MVGWFVCGFLLLFVGGGGCCLFVVFFLTVRHFINTEKVQSCSKTWRA